MLTPPAAFKGWRVFTVGDDIAWMRVGFFFSSRRRHTRLQGDWSSDVCSFRSRRRRSSGRALRGQGGRRGDPRGTRRPALSQPARRRRGDQRLCRRARRPPGAAFGARARGAAAPRRGPHRRRDRAKAVAVAEDGRDLPRTAGGEVGHPRRGGPGALRHPARARFAGVMACRAIPDGGCPALPTAWRRRRSYAPAGNAGLYARGRGTRWRAQRAPRLAPRLLPSAEAVRGAQHGRGSAACRSGAARPHSRQPRAARRQRHRGDARSAQAPPGMPGGGHVGDRFGGLAPRRGRGGRRGFRLEARAAQHAAADPGSAAEVTTRHTTVLFADMSGSTKLYDSVGDTAAFEAIGACIDRLRQSAEADGGRVVKTMGDEVMVLFPSPDAAASAATRMHTAIESLPVVGNNKLALRIGFHTGPVVQQNNDIFGDTVNIASRLADQAVRGQILTSRETAALLSGFIRNWTRPLYSIQIRGKAEEVPICEIVWHQSPDVTEAIGSSVARKPAPVTLRLQYNGQEAVRRRGQDAIMIGRGPDCELVIS